MKEKINNLLDKVIPLRKLNREIREGAIEIKRLERELEYLTSRKEVIPTYYTTSFKYARIGESLNDSLTRLWDILAASPWLDSRRETIEVLKKYREINEGKDFDERLPTLCVHSIQQLHEMRCPICGELVSFGDFKLFESISEHVGDVNGVRPYRPTLICTNKSCLAYQKGYWTEMDLEWLGDEVMVIGTGYEQKYAPDILCRNNNVGARYFNYKYTEDGIYIGDTWQSRFIDWFDMKFYAKEITRRWIDYYDSNYGKEALECDS